MNTQPKAGEVSIDIAEVSIKLVSVGGKSMTVSIYNQLPHVATRDYLEGPESDPKPIVTRHGRINRCSNNCPKDLPGHSHVFGVNAQGEPVLELVDSRAVALWNDIAYIKRDAGNNFEQRLEGLKSYESDLERRLAKATTDQARDREAERLEEARRKRKLFEALPVELDEVRHELELFRAWHREVIEPLPQLYIAK